MVRMILSILFVFFVLIGPTAASAVPFVQIQGNDGLLQTPSASNIGGTYGDFRIDRIDPTIDTIIATPGPSLNTLTLSNTTVTNTGAGSATLSIIYSNLFSPVDTAVQRFYGTSMSGSFARGFDPATGDSITLNAFVDYRTPGEVFRSGSGTIDPNKTFAVPLNSTSPTDNVFAPQNPSQGTASFLCSNVLDAASCAQLETLRTQLSIVLGPGDSLSLLGTITTLAGDQASVNQALADLARVPAPPTLLLFGSGLAAPALRWMSRKRLFRKGKLDTNG